MQASRIAKAVKETQSGKAITDLVFNPITGEFEEAPYGIVPAVGDVVTEMTRYGFA